MAKTKIATKAFIKQITTKEKGTDLKFDGLSFTDEQIEKLTAYCRGKDEVNITIECVQEKLPGTE